MGKMKFFQFGKVHGGLPGNLKEVSCFSEEMVSGGGGCLKENTIP